MKFVNPYRRIRELERQLAESKARFSLLEDQVAAELRSATQTLRDNRSLSEAVVAAKDKQIAFLEGLIEKARGDEGKEREYTKRLVDSVIRDKGLPGVAQIPTVDQGGPVEGDPDEMPFEEWVDKDAEDEIEEHVAKALADSTGTLIAMHKEAAEYGDPDHAAIYKRILQATTGHGQGPIQ